VNLDEISLSTSLFQIGGTPVTVATLISLAVILVGAFWLSRALQRLLARGMKLVGVTDEGTVAVASRLTHYFIVVTGFAIALQTVGINLSGLFAAGALFAVGIGFATQNVLQNFLSGVILLTERAIKPGDVLEVEGRVVRVSRMGFRTTVVRTRDEEDLIVPNTTLVQSTVKNYTLRDTSYRLRTVVGVSYHSDMALVRKVLEDVARAQDFRKEDVDPAIFMAEFGSSSVNFDVSVWLDDPWGTQRTRSKLNEAIWWAFQEAGITIAFPQVDVHFDPPVAGSLETLAQGRLREA
jgi:small-conductance mechanosensitive channel